MKVIDQTPYFNEKGEISVVDRGKAIMRFGASWFKEIEAQKQVMAVLDKLLDKNYTLLRNVTPPELETSIPFILVGPTGVYVMFVTHLTGMFRAKGDLWGTIVGNNFKPEKPNLLTRTERMARAVQVYLQRQGYNEIASVEAILLCADPSVHVDSLRPIVRIVMRDALERFAVSVTQQRVVLSPESVKDVVERIQTLPKPEPAPAPEQPAQPEQPVASNDLDGLFQNTGFTDAPTQPPSDAFPATTPTAARQMPPAAGRPTVRPRAKISGKQIAFLVGMFVFWCLIVAGFIYLVIQDF